MPDTETNKATGIEKAGLWKMWCYLRPEENEARSHAGIWEKNSTGRWNSKHKGFRGYLRDREKSSVSEAEWAGESSRSVQRTKREGETWWGLGHHSEDFVFQSEVWRHGWFRSEEPCDPRQLYEVRGRDQREALTHQGWLSLQLHTFICVFVCSIAQLCLTFTTPWTVACQTPLSMRFSRQEQWSGLPFFPPGNLPNSGIEPMSPAVQVDSFITEPPFV